MSVAILMSKAKDTPDQIVYFRRSFQLPSDFSHRLYARPPKTIVKIRVTIDNVQNMNKKFILIPETCKVATKEAHCFVCLSI